MPPLLELQRRFGAALLARRDWERYCDVAIDPTHRVPPRDRLAAYRSNIIGNLRGALVIAYPVVAAIVGDEFFEGLAREFAFRNPSNDGDLSAYGEGFAGFLTQFPPALSLPYLGDVARLEWTVHRAYGAADEPAFDPAGLAAVAPECWPGLRPRLRAGSGVIRSMYSICRIWRMHQPGEQVTALGTPAVPEIALVCRLARRVEVTRVEPGKASFLDACAAGASLEEANAAATGVDPDFDIRRSLAGFVQSGTIVGLASP